MKVYVNFYESIKEAVEKAVTKAPDSSIEPTQEKPQKDQPARNSEFLKSFPVIPKLLYRFSLNI